MGFLKNIIGKVSGFLKSRKERKALKESKKEEKIIKKTKAIKPKRQKSAFSGNSLAYLNFKIYIEAFPDPIRSTILNALNRLEGMYDIDELGKKLNTELSDRLKEYLADEGMFYMTAVEKFVGEMIKLTDDLEYKENLEQYMEELSGIYDDENY